MESAERSGRRNIADALRAKLQLLTGTQATHTETQTRNPSRKPPKAQKQSATLNPEVTEVAEVTEVTEPSRGFPPKPLRKKRKREAPSRASATMSKTVPRLAEPEAIEGRVEESAKPPGVASRPSKARTKSARVATRKGSKKATLDSASSPDAQQAAVDILMKAAAKARALRQAAGEESEEEAPLPDLPPVRTGLGEDSGQATNDPVHSVRLSHMDFDSEEDKEDMGSDTELAMRKQGAPNLGQDEHQHKQGQENGEEEDDDFFDLEQEERPVLPPDSGLRWQLFSFQRPF